MKIIIAGSRDFGKCTCGRLTGALTFHKPDCGFRSHQDLLYAAMDKIRELRLSHDDEVEVVSGTARGADTMGELWAVERDLTVHTFPANWDKFGKSAGYRRNEEMAVFADAAVVFWDGASRGSEHMINLARKHGLIVKVIRF